MIMTECRALVVSISVYIENSMKPFSYKFVVQIRFDKNKGFKEVLLEQNKNKNLWIWRIVFPRMTQSSHHHEQGV